jgi:UDP:flavonoid glycosyltransferase YjiC (YdhE family)
MKVLVCCWAWGSHYMPLVPLGWALRAAGHDVRVASQPGFARVITDSGLVAVPTGPDLDHAEVHRRVLRDLRLSAVPDAPPAGESMAGWQPGPRERVRRVFGVFAAYAEAMLDDLYGYARSWRPDLIVFDPTTYAAPLVASALDIPAVRHTHGVDVIHQAREVVPELLAPLAERLGIADLDIAGVATVDPCPPSIQIPSDLRRLPVRYIPYNGPAVLPAWLLEPPGEKQRVCVTWGTSTTRFGDAGLFAPPMVVDAVRDLDVELVVALRDADVATFGPPPPGVRVVEGLALHLLLPTCRAVIHQGGNGTLLTAAWYGLPQLALPQLPDQTFHVRQFVTAGNSIAINREQRTAATVRTALQALLTEPGYRAAADRLHAEMLATPAPAQILPDLMALAGHNLIGPNTSGPTPL